MFTGEDVLTGDPEFDDQVAVYGAEVEAIALLDDMTRKLIRRLVPRNFSLRKGVIEIGGTVMLPGTNRAADRFARASFYVNAIPKSEEPVEAIASVFSVIRNVSVPFGITTPDQPNISSTRWRTVADQKRKLYFFESALTPNIFWADLTRFDFSEETGKVMKLDLGPNQTNIYSGLVNAEFTEAEPFKFLGL